jgi:hypothetical protein
MLESPKIGERLTKMRKIKKDLREGERRRSGEEILPPDAIAGLESGIESLTPSEIDRLEMVVKKWEIEQLATKWSLPVETVTRIFILVDANLKEHGIYLPAGMIINFLKNYAAGTQVFDSTTTTQEIRITVMQLRTAIEKMLQEFPKLASFFKKPSEGEEKEKTVPQ